MTKHEFLIELRRQLEKLSVADVEMSLDYYAEMIDDRIEEGASEEEAVKSIGSPLEIAAQIQNEKASEGEEKSSATPRRRLAAWEIVLLILGAPIWLPLLVSVLTVIVSVFAVIWSLVAGLWGAEISVGACAVMGILYLPIYLVQGKIWAGVTLLGTGIFLAGLSIFLFYGCRYATVGALALSKKIVLLIKACFVRKERRK